MAKVKITGHASGSGVFTITAPNSNTDRTITLPDASVTLGTDATKLPLTGGTLTGDLIVGDTSSNQSSIRIRDDDTSVYIGAEASACWVGMDSGIASGTNLGIYADGRGLSQFTAKVWVKFNGQNTVAINDSHNVSSITDHGTGDHSINFSNNLGNTHYCSVGSTSTLSGSGSYFIDTGVGFAAGANRIGTKHTNGDYYDRPYNMVLIFGD